MNIIEQFTKKLTSLTVEGKVVWNQACPEEDSWYFYTRVESISIRLYGGFFWPVMYIDDVRYCGKHVDQLYNEVRNQIIDLPRLRVLAETESKMRKVIES